ncbi:MAG: hypothetical protein HND57_17140 [Planctomycetes bacterium]|nr:hypothetical protein [Planctomycetota bacterium]
MTRSSACINAVVLAGGIALAGLLAPTASADLITDSQLQIQELIINPMGDPKGLGYDGFGDFFHPEPYENLIGHGNWIIPGDDDETKGAIMPGDPDQMFTPIGGGALPGFEFNVIPSEFDGGKSLWDNQIEDNGTFTAPFAATGITLGDGLGGGFRDDSLPPIPTPQALWPLAIALTCFGGRRRRES